MTIQNTTRKVRSDGNGSVTAFSFPFKIFSASELEVYKVNKTTQVATLQTLTTHYTVSINTITEGGTVTFVTAPTSNEEAFIRRVLARTQTTDIPNVGAVRETQLENQFDREIMILQELEEEISRTIRLPSTSLLSNLEFPDPDAGKVLAWNDDEDGFENVDNPATAADDAAASAVAAASSASAASSSASAAASSASAASSSASAASASASAAAASAAAAENTLSVSQAAHGLAVNDMIRFNGTAYVKAQADSLANSEVIGIVTAVADVDNFTYTKTKGARITTLSGLSAGSVYYLSPSVAGAVTATEPTTAGQVTKPVLVALSTTSAIFTNGRGLALPIGGNVGDIIMTGRSSAPSGWLLCDGSAVSRTTYAALFSAIGTAFGVGDGSTTFNVPDLRQRFPLGKAASGTGSTLGGTGGNIDHAHGAATGSTTLTESQIPSHSHIQQIGTGTGTAVANLKTSSAGGGSNNTVTRAATTDTTDVSTLTTGGGTGHTHTVSTDNPPFQAVNFIIKT